MDSSAILTWQQRLRILRFAAPMALFPALAILPSVIYLVFLPVVAHGGPLALVVTLVLGLASARGVILLIRIMLDASFDLITAMASAVLMVMVFVGFYTGLFMAAFLVQLRP